jgi:hypothetical protein
LIKNRIPEATGITHERPAKKQEMVNIQNYIKNKKY